MCALHPTPQPRHPASAPPPAPPRLQVGRAGRGGSEARCVALLDDGDFVRLRSLAFSSVLDLAAVRAFLAAVFSPAAEGQRVRRGGKVGKAAGKSAAAGGRSRKRKAATAAAGMEDGGSDHEAAASDDKEGVQAAAAAPTASRRRRGRQQKQQQQEAGEGAAEEEQPATEEEERQQPASGDAEQQHEAGSGEAAAAEGEEASAGAGARRRFGVLAVRQLAAELDMREDSMEAVLSYLEADDAPCLRMLPATALSVKVSFYAAAPEALAAQHPVVQVRPAGCWWRALGGAAPLDCGAPAGDAGVCCCMRQEWGRPISPACLRMCRRLACLQTLPTS